MKMRRLLMLCLLLGRIPCPGAEPLRTLAEVQALSDDAASHGQAVRVEAVVLYADPLMGSTIIHDGTTVSYNGVNLLAANPESRPKIGDRVRFDAITRLQGFLRM